MSSIPESTYFAHDKEKLLQALTRFDGDITVEDVIDGIDSNESYNARHYHTVLLQILLESICNDFVKTEHQREILLNEICKRLSSLKLVNPALLMDKNNPLRIEIKHKFFDFVIQILNEVIPDAEVDTSIVSFLESKKLSVDPDFCFYKCFEPLEEVGRGGYGVVFKAKDKLTQHIYAVKKILFNYKNDAHYLKVMREAKNIAAVDHPNVVRYNNAWIEVVPTDCDGKQSTGTSSSGSLSEDCDKTGSDNDVSFCTKGVSAIVITEKHSKTSLDSSRSIENYAWKTSSDFDSNKSSESVIFSESVQRYSTNITWTLGSDNEFTNEETVDETASDSDSSDETANVGNMSFRLNLNVRGMLHIQMEYCDCDLRFWLDERAKRNKLPFNMDVTEIFTNILNGLDHIHSKDIIHRDLKPQNIFYSKASNCLKIGDFGLATLPGCSSTNCSNKKHLSNLFSGGVGTLPYAAPEQIASKSYDSKVDIYSLGVILIELMNTFSTSMEFSKAISDVKNNKITEEMKKSPHLVKLATNLISNNPKDRMSAKEILAYLEEGTKVELKEIKRILKEKELELTKMNELVIKLEMAIHQKDEEIARLHAIIETPS